MSRKVSKENKKKLPRGSGTLWKRKDKYFYRNKTIGISDKSLNTGNYEEAVDIVIRDYLPLKHLQTRQEILLQVAQAKKFFKKKSFPLNIEKADELIWKKFKDNPSRNIICDDLLKTYQSRLSKFLEWLKAKHPHIIDLAQVTEDISKEYASYLWELKVAAKTFNDYMIQLGIIFRYTIGEEAAEIWAEKHITRHTPQYHSRKELDQAELKKVFDVFKDTKYQLEDKSEIEILFYLGAYTGLRLKDCALLKWIHVNFDRNIISVIPYKTLSKTQQRVNIPLHSELKEKLINAQSWQKDKNEYVLPLTAERYKKNKWSISQSCGRVFKKAGFEVQGTSEVQRQNDANDYGFSSFRHSFVSFCANAGVPLPVVQSIVGHSSTAITRFYIHIGEKAVKDAIDALPGSKKIQSAEDKINSIKELLSKKKKISKTEQAILDILK